MRAQRRIVLWLVLALIAALGLTACYRPAGEDLEPTTVGQGIVPATLTLAPAVTEPPLATAEAPEVQAVTEEPVEAGASGDLASPTAEVITPPPTALAPNGEGQGGQSGETGPTQTQVVAMVPTFTASPSPTSSPTTTPTPTPTLDPAFGIPADASPVPFDQPFPTFTPGDAAAGEGVPIGERPTETLAPIEGQGGEAGLVGETPVAIAQQPTLTTNQMTATVVVYEATARAAATLGTPVQPLAPEGQVDQSGAQQQPVVPTSTPVPAGPTTCGEHLISPGETLSRIALQYGVTTTQMAQANNIVNADLIKAGDSLIVPCAQAAAAAVDTSGQGGQSGTTTTTGGPTVYVVQAGDNIYRISLRFGITMSELIAANGMTPSSMNLISVGQELVIPYTTVTAATAAPVVPTATPLPTLAAQPTQAGATVG